MANGAIIYQGPSMLDGAPIVVVVTGLEKSRNVKTGNMLQTWILRSDVAPQAAIKSGDDASICGGCGHRGTIEDGKLKGRTCYVNVAQAPASVFRSIHRGIYPTVDDVASIGRGRVVRLGSYGDPAAVPVSVWKSLVSEAVAHTGYTHQWRRFPELAALCMASCDTAQERFEARMAGFRTFRVRKAAEPTLSREVICPASQEAGEKTQCAACRACGGNSAKARADIVIMAHGIGKYAFERKSA